MKASRFRPGDSLDLLLDTMCNTFGGIILIAILVALISSQSRSPLQPAERAQSEMIERRLAMAQIDLASTKARRAKLEESTTPELTTLANEKQRLIDAISGLKASTDADYATTRKAASAKSGDPSQILLSLGAEASAQQNQIVALQNAIASQTENSNRLRLRLDALAIQIDKEVETRTKQLRLPKERTKTKQSFSVILRYGKAYPLTDSSGTRNTVSIDWEENDDSHIPKPMATSGADANGLRQLFGNLPREEVYVAFYVYPDSFETFESVREVAVERGCDYGLEIVPAGNILRFGKNGTSPPPL